MFGESFAFAVKASLLRASARRMLRIRSCSFGTPSEFGGASLRFFFEESLLRRPIPFGNLRLRRRLCASHTFGFAEARALRARSTSAKRSRTRFARELRSFPFGKPSFGGLCPSGTFCFAKARIASQFEACLLRKQAPFGSKAPAELVSFGNCAKRSFARWIVRAFASKSGFAKRSSC